MDKIIFSLSKVPDAISERMIYTAHVQTNGTVGRDELANPTFHVRRKNPSGCWGFGRRSSLHFRFCSLRHVA